ncbi:MAG: efflux RND transporter periplasmic adaptor subunit [Lachnospiraceae bacterium]|nr:efflux RND transporter periplasmic adaptor subunit [Lachnospiraceae bacterium]
MKNSHTGKNLIKMTAVLCASSMVLGGCGLFSGEEEKPSVSIVRESMADDYNVVNCERRDVVLTSTVSCSYTQLMEENLAFPVGDKTVAYVYVNEGDEVKEGDLLAKLDVEQLEKDNISMQEEIEKNEFLIKQTDEMIDFYEKKINSASLSLSSKESYLSKLQKLREKKRNYTDQNEFDQIKISANEQQIAAGSLYAGMDGNISFIKNNLQGSNANAQEKVITILNASVCGFQTNDRNAVDYIHVGDRVSVDISTTDTSYDATVTVVDKDAYKIVYELDQPDYSIQMGTRGKVTVVRGEAKNVMALPVSCVFRTDDFAYVYILNNDGVREMRKVTIGLIGDDYVEITGGISETDTVILRQS